MPSWGGHTPGVETQFAVNYLGLWALLVAYGMDVDWSYWS